jgi:hypothetical protein
MLPDEIRQMPKFRQLLVVTDTAPPVKAAFPPVYLRRDIQKPVIYRKPEVLRFSDVLGLGGYFAQTISTNDATFASTKLKKTAKKKKAENQSQAVSVQSIVNPQSDLDLSVPPETKLDFAFSEITDRALGEIGERIANFEKDGTSDSYNNFLALAGDKTSGNETEDYMKEDLKTLLGGENPKVAFQIENNSEDEEIIDCFDSETSLVNEATQNSSESDEIKHEITLSTNFTLTDEEAAREQLRANKKLESENEFNNALALRVL